MTALSENAAKLAAGYFSVGRFPLLVSRTSARVDGEMRDALSELVEKGYVRRQRFGEFDLFIQIKVPSAFELQCRPNCRAEKGGGGLDGQ